MQNSGNYVKAEKGGGHYDRKIWQRGRFIGEIGEDVTVKFGNLRAGWGGRDMETFYECCVFLLYG